jgi:hypothetical protein
MIYTGQEQTEAEMKTGLVEVEITDLEADPEEIKSVMKRPPWKISGPLEDRYGDRNLAVGRRRQQKKRIQSNCGSRKKLAAARRRLIRRAFPARRKGGSCRGPSKTTGNSIRGRSRRQELHLGSKKTLYEALGQTSIWRS